MDSSLINLVRQNFIAKSSYFARFPFTYFLPGAAFEETATYAAVNSGLPSDTFNVIIPKSSDSTALTALFDHTIQPWNQQQRPFAFWCWEDTYSSALSTLLDQYGLVSDEQNVAMWLNLQMASLKPLSVSALTIRAVQTPAEYEQFADVIAELFGTSPEAEQIRIYYQRVGAIRQSDQPMKLYVGEYDGHIVATGTLFLYGSSAGIYDIATRPAWRGRGFGSQLFHHLLLEAKDHSIQEVVLQASAEGLGIYKRAGFVEVGHVQVFGNRHLFV
ncbi:GNAT family N-acetyltransferase [Spirosoma terrae]|uniref:GNAT family N-acetyltransferase n=1 Tax=Spirosoma terrae TaxID=1968276 RepID=A0A6L9LHH0_9BACT|nr:GNAT family N-acetyltransferase [Spirosoma terrae]NDU98363.1 GNAT family N-acetyltransferase [Spirosoma terrae]